jgi:hypothetical protein
MKVDRGFNRSGSTPLMKVTVGSIHHADLTLWAMAKRERSIHHLDRFSSIENTPPTTVDHGFNRSGSPHSPKVNMGPMHEGRPWVTVGSIDI